MKMVNPLGLGDRPESYGYRYYFGVLVGFVALSVGGNVLHGTTSTVVPVVVAASHGAPPLIFALMVHLGTTLASSFAGAMRRPGPRPERGERHLDWASVAVVVSLVAAVTTVAVIALYVSFEGLTGLAVTLGWGPYAWTLPVLLDVPAGVATLGVLLATHAMRSDERAVDGADRPSVVTQQTLVTDQGDHDADQPVTVVSDHADHVVTDQLTTPVTTAADHGDQAVTVVSDHADHVADQLTTTADQPVVTASELGEWLVTDHADHGDDVVSDQADHPVTTTTDQPAQLVTDHGDHPVTVVSPVVSDHADHAADHPVTTTTDQVDQVVIDQSTDHDDQPVDPIDFEDLAKRLRRDLDVDVAVLATALGLVAAGVSRRKVAERVGVGSHNTVKRWVDAAVEVDADYAAAVGRGGPRLTAVR
ncbi:DUF2637 domain-containing protein [Gordonia otitidis]|uniref:DUF2637 domain-containing protein n=1 Tax=Gordonia otitidis TaxID=249058 RepID=UPI002357A075|nr:DUF2637 domain-containing protein [Gordonia otitidis]